MERLLKYCNSDTQTATLKAVIQHGGVRPAARALGKTHPTVQRIMKTLRFRAAQDGFDPDAGLLAKMPANQVMKNITLQGQISEAGEFKPTQAWLKGAQKNVSDIIEIMESHRPTIVKPPKRQTTYLLEDILSLYTITDFHLGMFACKQETGNEWSADIARQTMVTAIDEMMSHAADSHTAVLNIQGDFMHFDGLDAVTPQSRHVLDADIRLGRMIDLAMDLVENAISQLLEKHENVHVVICEGNHDESGSAWLRKHTKRCFSSDRVTVDDSDFPHYAYQFGNVMLGFHHGHKVKLEKMPAFFASEPRFKPIWGACDYVYLHCGHYHQQEERPIDGAMVRRHPTLSAKDAYAARSFTHSNRGACVIDYHKDDGEVGCFTVRPR